MIINHLKCLCIDVFNAICVLGIKLFPVRTGVVGLDLLCFYHIH